LNPALCGGIELQVDKPSALVAGQLYDMWFTDVRGKFNNHM
jgi:activating signal cointegrator complex subunit 1